MHARTDTRKTHTTWTRVRARTHPSATFTNRASHQSFSSKNHLEEALKWKKHNLRKGSITFSSESLVSSSCETRTANRQTRASTPSLKSSRFFSHDYLPSFPSGLSEIFNETFPTHNYLQKKINPPKEIKRLAFFPAPHAHFIASVINAEAKSLTSRSWITALNAARSAGCSCLLVPWWESCGAAVYLRDSSMKSSSCEFHCQKKVKEFHSWKHVGLSFTSVSVNCMPS